MILPHDQSSEHPPPPEENPADALPTSGLLISIVASCPEGPISVGNLIDGLGERAFSILFLILTLPMAIPGPPGLPTAFSIPLLIFTAQLFLGYSRPGLPGFIRRRHFSRNALLGVLKRVRPTLARIENVCRPRMLRLTNRRSERWLGAFMFVCALILVNPIPIPFSHLPLGMALVIFSIGYVERDGAIIIVGIVGAVIGAAINISLMGSIFMLAVKLLHFA